MKEWMVGQMIIWQERQHNYEEADWKSNNDRQSELDVQAGQ
jgi:hypothetical protein